MKSKFIILGIAVIILIGIIIAILLTQQTVITPIDKESCEARGGKWGLWDCGDRPDCIPKCNEATLDGGKECSDSSECETYCEAPEGADEGSQAVGKCSGWEIKLTDCMQEIEDGNVGSVWCLHVD